MRHLSSNKKEEESQKEGNKSLNERNEIEGGMDVSNKKSQFEPLKKVILSRQTIKALTIEALTSPEVMGSMSTNTKTSYFLLRTQPRCIRLSDINAN